VHCSAKDSSIWLLGVRSEAYLLGVVFSTLRAPFLGILGDPYPLYLFINQVGRNFLKKGTLRVWYLVVEEQFGHLQLGFLLIQGCYHQIYNLAVFSWVLEALARPYL
jgi:hypothetical protein